MFISRRAFLDYSTKIMAALGLSAAGLAHLQEVLADPLAPRVIWLKAACCSGCSVSFLNYFSATPPATAADIFISSVNLMYHPVLMGAQGDQSTSVIQDALNTGGYILAVEGGIPNAFGGNACTMWDSAGVGVTAKNALISLASKASQILAIGTCAAYGGVPKTGANPAQIANVATILGRPTVNIAGCPTHPDWIVWAIVNAITGTIGTLDAYGRPTALYVLTGPPFYAPYIKIHGNCPKELRPRVTTYGIDCSCLFNMGCKGRFTIAQCPFIKWNNRASWCTEVDAPCLGCVNNTFPGTAALHPVSS